MGANLAGLDSVQPRWARRQEFEQFSGATGVAAVRIANGWGEGTFELGPAGALTRHPFITRR
jgi:hypothetical protein